MITIPIPNPAINIRKSLIKLYKLTFSSTGLDEMAKHLDSVIIQRPLL